MKYSKQEYVTRTEFDSNNTVIAKSFERIMQEFALVREDIKALQDNFAEVMFELKAIREDLAAITFRHVEISDTLDSHDNKLTVVEKKLLV